ncbi:hypothetical protein [Nonomuraea jiangxiensis]|uniref:hypothetical protein n=1 Tax=Nonomuraea jiangxiensis TaxID=633440 RepID=UPI001C408CEA|nr:hypothetical protein [Nonomuraea jiangxiensis]
MRSATAAMPLAPGTPDPPRGTGLCDLPGADAICAGVGGAAESVAAGGMLDELAAALQEAQVKVLSMMAGFWARTPAPPLSDSVGPVAWLQERTHWYVGLLAVLGLIIAAGQLALRRRAEPAIRATAGLLTLTVVTGCATAAMSLLVEAGDAYSTWIVGQALDGGDFTGAITRLAGFQTLTLPPGLMIILAFVSIISCVLQIMLMLARVALLGLLTGLLPMAAALSGTQAGRTWLTRIAVWGLAFALYKPAAATVYSYAFLAMGTPASELAQMSGLVVIALAVVALPALMRLLAPAISTVGSGGGGSGAATFGTGVATGARVLPASGWSHSAAPGADAGRGGTPAGPCGARTTAPAPDPLANATDRDPGLAAAAPANPATANAATTNASTTNAMTVNRTATDPTATDPATANAATVNPTATNQTTTRAGATYRRADGSTQSPRRQGGPDGDR